jgi:hypothetical protein
MSRKKASVYLQDQKRHHQENNSKTHPDQTLKLTQAKRLCVYFFCHIKSIITGQKRLFELSFLKTMLYLCKNCYW